MDVLFFDLIGFLGSPAEICTGPFLEEGTMQSVSIGVHMSPCCTQYLVAARLLWSLCDTFWISSIDTNLQIPFVWGEPVSESIVGVVCCCDWSMSFELVRLGQSVVFCIDLGFFWCSVLWILYIVHMNRLFVRCTQFLLFEEGWVKLLWVLVHHKPYCTLWLVYTSLFWSVRVFFWIYNITINVQISFVRMESVRESIVGVYFCCQCACHVAW
jgi:hypothetical protein